MSTPPATPRPAAPRPWLAYAITVVLVAAATFGVLLLWQNIAQRKREGQEQHAFRVVELTEDVIDPEEWGKYYPRQYDGYRRTVDNERTRHGGSEAEPPQRLDIFKSLRTLYDGYPFSVDFRTARGHAYMLSDQDQT